MEWKWAVESLPTVYIRPGKLDLLSCISHLLNLCVSGRSFVTSKRYTHLANLGTTVIKSEHAIVWKAD